MRTPKEFLPPHWAASREVAAFHSANEVQLDRIFQALQNVFEQLDPCSAVEALSDWEKAYGIVPAASVDVEARRGHLLAKLRGRGTTTAQAIKDVAASCLGMDVVVAEYPAEHRVEVRTVESTPDDERVAMFRSTLAEILPAHLECNVVTDYLMIIVSTSYVQAHSGNVVVAAGVLATCNMADDQVWTEVNTPLGPGACGAFYVDRSGRQDEECCVTIHNALNMVFDRNTFTVPLSGSNPYRISARANEVLGPWVIANDRQDFYLAGTSDYGGSSFEAWGIGGGGGCDGGEHIVHDGGSTQAYWTTAAYAGGGSGYARYFGEIGKRTLLSALIGHGGSQGRDGGDTKLTLRRDGEAPEVKVAPGGKAAVIALNVETPRAPYNHADSGVVANGGDGGTGGGAAGAAQFNWRSAGDAGVDGDNGGDTTVANIAPCTGRKGLGGVGSRGDESGPIMYPFAGSPNGHIAESCGAGGPGLAFTGVDPDAYVGGPQGNAINTVVRGAGNPSALGYGDGGYATVSTQFDLPTFSMVDGKPGVIYIRKC